MDGIFVIDEDTGQTLHRLAVPAAGNPLAMDAQLVIASSDVLDVYMSFGRAEEMLRDRIATNPEDAEPALSLLQLGLRVRDLSLALEGADLSLAAVNRIGDPRRASQGRRELFSMLLEMHRADIATSPVEQEALYAMIGAVAVTAEQRVEYLLALGDGLARQRPARSVESYQSIMSDPVLAATVRVEAGLLRPAAQWAAGRLSALIAQHGKSVYAAQDDYARRALADALRNRRRDEDAFVAIVLEFPFAGASIDAALHVAALRRERGEYRPALAILAQAYHLAPVPDRGERLLGAFVDLCVENDQSGQARSVLEGLVGTVGNVTLETPAGRRKAAEWLADLATADGDSRLPRIGTTVQPAHGLVGRLLVPPDGRISPSADRALLLNGAELRLVHSRNLETLWTTDIEDPDARLLAYERGEILLWMGEREDNPRVIALDPGNGRSLWTTARLSDHIAPPLIADRGVLGQMPDGMPFDPRQTLPLLSDESVILVQRTGGVAAFDRTTDGGLRWSAATTLTQVHLAEAHGFGLVLAGVDRNDQDGTGRLEPLIVVLDPRTGETRLRLRPQTNAGVLWMIVDPLGSLLCATEEGLDMIDLLQGRRRWTNMANDATDTRRGWRTDLHAIVEGRNGDVFSLAFEDGRISEPFDIAVRGEWEPDSLRDLHMRGDRIVARYRDRIIRYDLSGNVLGADVISDNREYRALAMSQEHLVVLSQHRTSQEPVPGQGGLRTERRYRIYLMSENCRLEADAIEVPPVTRRFNHAALIDGWLLLSTSSETMALGLTE